MTVSRLATTTTLAVLLSACTIRVIWDDTGDEGTESGSEGPVLPAETSGDGDGGEDTGTGDGPVEPRWDLGQLPDSPEQACAEGVFCTDGTEGTCIVFEHECPPGWGVHTGAGFACVDESLLEQGGPARCGFFAAECESEWIMSCD